MHDHQPLSVRAGLPRLRPCCARPFASNFSNNPCALPNSLLSNHVSFQRTLYSVSGPAALFSRISVISHSCSSTSAGPPGPWCCSVPSGLVAVALAEPSMADLLPLWEFAWIDRLSRSANGVMLGEHRRLKGSAVVLGSEKWCVFGSFAEQGVLSWVSAVSISDIMLSISAEVPSSSVLMSSSRTTNGLSVECQTPFHFWVRGPRSVPTLTATNLTRPIWACSILVVLERSVVVKSEFRRNFEYSL